MHLSRRTLLTAAAVAPLSSFRALAAPLDNLAPSNIALTRTDYLGRSAVRLRLDEETQRRVLAGQAANGPTFALTPGVYRNFSLTTSIAGEVNGLGAADSRAFVGIAFRAQPDGSRFEAIYLRMTNGTLAEPTPPPPRNVRAIQYVAYPDFRFDRSRQEAPGVYEKAAAVGPKRWHRLRLEVAGATARAFIDDAAEPALVVNDLRSGADGSGQIGLFVDDGTDGYFSDLRIATA
ncbi:MAG: hypothetical protein ACOVVK_06735 [Elsteraceae bacterium]